MPRTPRPVRRSALAAALAFGLLPAALAGAQTTAPAEVPPPRFERPRQPLAPEARADTALTRETFGAPPAELARVVAAPRWRNVQLDADQASPDGARFVVARAGALPTMAEFSRPHVYLGGVQVDTRANRARSLTTRGADDLDVLDARTGRLTRIQLPAGATASSARWSPDGQRVAFLANVDDGSYLYVADAATGRSRRLTPRPLLATLVTDVAWSGDGAQLLAVLVPARRAPAPREDAEPDGPKVKVSLEGKNKTRTWASLLETPHEQALLEYHATGQLALIDAARGTVREVGAPAMFRAIDLAPDGRYAKVTLMRKPFSYYVPTSSFGTVDQLWSTDGRVVATLGERELRLGDPYRQDDDAGADTTKRNLAWSPDGQGFLYLQQAPAADSAAGDSAAAGRRTAARRKDRVMQWRAPFGAGDASVLWETDGRLTNVQAGTRGDVYFVTERQGTGRSAGTHTYAIVPSEPGKRYTIARTLGAEGASDAAQRAADSAFYADPGRLMTAKGRFGLDGVLVSGDGSAAYLAGVQYGKDPLAEAPRPFVDRIVIRTGEKTRVFQSAADVHEQVVTALDPDFREVVTRRESPTMVPDAYRRDLVSGRLTKLTDNRDHTPEVTALERRTVTVTRVDGTRFWVDVTLPTNWTGERLPALFWFYPREFEDQADYDRSKRTYNRNRFPATGTRSMDYFALRGYAVVEPDAPILGPSGRMNDNYVADLRNNLSAVIDELDRQGIIDRQRLAVGGHSYGAFSTVNAMVHTPFFKAGIAGDGNYNRSLTPNGFQSERRDLWEARDVYLGVSPFYQANQLQGALLMYHGEADQNVGTAPENSTRLFHALQGLGKTVALYMYPYEDHGPATQETLLDLWSRWSAWLDLHVKNAPTATPATPTRAMN